MKNLKKISLFMMAVLVAFMSFKGCSNTASESSTAESKSESSSLSSEESEAVSSEESSEEESLSDSHETEAAELQAALNGTYEELWPVILNSKFDQTWIDDCTAVVGEEKAAESVEMLKAFCMGTVIGDEAVEAYSGQESFAFDCEFTGGVSEFTFDGNTISGADAEGNELFSHTYNYISYSEEMGFYIYESEDADSGEFTYFAMAPDTMAETYHIEFRYGSDAEALGLYDSGAYAYWMAAGIEKDCDDATAEKAINLFCTENLSGE